MKELTSLRWKLYFWGPIFSLALPYPISLGCLLIQWHYLLMITWIPLQLIMYPLGVVVSLFIIACIFGPCYEPTAWKWQDRIKEIKKESK